MEEKKCRGARQLDAQYETAQTKMHPSRKDVESSSEELVPSK